MRVIKYIFILSCLLPIVVFSLESANLCPSSFSHHREFIRAFFEDLQNRDAYEGQRGYIEFVEEYLNFLQMDTVFKYASFVLSKDDMQSLNWQKYHGTTKEFREERSRILNKEGNIEKTYRGLKGYARYVDAFYGEKRKKPGDMQRTYMNVSAVLSESEKKNLNWQKYEGTIKEFRKERSRILNKEGNIKKIYRGLKGYARYADKFYGGEKKEFGDMQKTYKNVLAVLSKKERENLAWKVFVGNTGQFHAVFQFFKNHDFEDYKGAEGQKKVARMIFEDHLSNTYKNISTLRNYLFKDRAEFQKLRESGWSSVLSW